MQTTSQPPTARNERGIWLTTAALLVLIAGGLVMSYLTRASYFWSLFKPGVPGMH